MKFLAPVLTAFVLFTGVANAAGPGEDAFKALRAAYAARDAKAAAAAYAPDAEVIYRYAGAPEDRRIGTAAITASFEELFSHIAANDRLDLNFRVIATSGERVTGFYRLRTDRIAPAYGRFDVTLAEDGRFQRDVSSDATLADFEMAAGPLLIADDGEALDRTFYEPLTGRYRLPDGCLLVVTRSSLRLFARNSCDHSFRGLNRVSGLVWTAGDRVRSERALATWRFEAARDGAAPAVVIETGGWTVTARRADAYRVEAVRFASKDGVLLKGRLYLPTGRPGRLAATVMIHGSGPQDRDGYASIMAVMADALAASGRAVLVYDKRGVGESAGDWSRAGFDLLAQDAIAAMNAGAARPEIDPGRIGLAGSSQAGWVAAAVLRQGGRPDDVFLLGAAGAALTVAEQNLYNTETRMRCAGMAQADIDLGLAQQRAFFAFLADDGAAPALDRLTEQGRARPALADWLFPGSRETDRSGGDWFVTLDPRFDPLPLWRAYQGHAVFVFSQHDDSTPTALALRRLGSLKVETHVLDGAQHVGLAAGDVCHAELTDLSAFSPALFSALESFAGG